MNHKLDTDQRVFFYEQEFYVLSNFSSFQVQMRGHTFMTAEHAYHWWKFADMGTLEAAFACLDIRNASSAHLAYELAQHYKQHRRSDWDVVKEDFMHDILRAKVRQHAYVKKKLIETGTRELIEDSWRDDYWGWGPEENGRNRLGHLWMKVRDELNAGLLD